MCVLSCVGCDDMGEMIAIVSDNLFGIILQFKSFVTNLPDHNSVGSVISVLFPATHLNTYMQLDDY